MGLLASVPRVDQTREEKLYSIPGSPPDLLDPPVGCPFAARCPYARRVCLKAMPERTVLS